jgi:ribonucleoside-diphosphate reductase alpha chain
MQIPEEKVTKRTGELQIVSFDKILKRIRVIGEKANVSINFTQLAIKIIDRLYDGIETRKIDEFTAEQCASMSSIHPDYETIASHIIISNHHKNTNPSFSHNVDFLEKDGIVESVFANYVKENAENLDSMIDEQRDYLIDYFGFKTLERAYLLKSKEGVIIERISHLWMRVAVCIHMNDLEKIKETYDAMSLKYFTHATPTLFNAGLKCQQLSSCFLLGMEEDSIEGIYDTLKDCALISKYAGGIGLHIHNVRAKGATVNGLRNVSNGIMPMLRVFNNTARYVDQGGKRNGSFAIYLEPWHFDIETFLDMKKNHGDEETKARDLFYGLWIPDLFMRRIKENKNWYLFCPYDFPGLDNVYGEAFDELYGQYEKECEQYEKEVFSSKIFKKISARELWFKILDSQMETGTPYLLYKDAANKKSNQQNIGVIKSSNLCTEIIEYSDETQSAVCNLASIGLPAFVKNKTFDYQELEKIVKVVTFNLNKIIDISFYPTKKTKKSNTENRPIGIGIQGLADVFFLMDVPFHSEEAKQINEKIFETIYFAALTESNHIASLEGAYSTFAGSPASKGILQFDLWNEVTKSTRYDWETLKQTIKETGIRNSLLIAPMPTASTSQILGYNECFEPITSNIYNRRTIAGEFMIINKYLIRELIDLGVWGESIKKNIIANKGSIQQIITLPQYIRDKYKTVWEIPMRHMIDMSADRGKYICQSQSLNCWVEEPNYNILTSMHFYSWSKGLKTGCYYLRRKPKHTAQQFTIEPDEVCEACSS